MNKRSYPILFDYLNNRKADLNEAINIVEELNLSKLNTLKFEYPYYAVDGYGKQILDDLGKPIKNYKFDFIENEVIVKFKDRYYIIKKDVDKRALRGGIYANVICDDIGFELTEKVVQFLSFIPPDGPPVNLETILNEILAAGQNVRDNTLAVGGTTSVTIDAAASDVPGFYEGHKLEILDSDGLPTSGAYITNYNATTKVCTLDDSITASGGDNYRIVNYAWRLGNIDSSFNISLRTHQFEFETLYSSMVKALEKYVNAENRIGKFDFQVQYDTTYDTWIKIINIVDVKPYEGISFEYRKNIKEVTREKDTSEIYTRVWAYGFENLNIITKPDENVTQSGVTYPKHEFGRNYVDNFQYYLAQGYTYKQCIDNFVKDFQFQDSVYVDQDDLYTDASAKLENISMPKVTYSMSAIDLSQLTEYKGIGEPELKVGDTVRVFDKEMNLDIYATIESISRPENDPWQAQVRLTNFVDNISDIITQIINGNEQRTRTITGNLAFQDFVDSNYVIDGAITETKISDGAIITPKLAANAVVAEKINVGQLSAISSNLGSITGGSLNIGSGNFTVNSSGIMTARGATIIGEFETIGTGGAISSRIYQETSVGGRMELNTNTGARNVLLGDSDGSGGNIGGTLKLYNRSESSPRIEMGIDSSYDSAAINLRGSGGSIRATLYAASNLGSDGSLNLWEGSGTTIQTAIRGSTTFPSYFRNKLAVGGTTVGSSYQMSVTGTLFATECRGNTIYGYFYRTFNSSDFTEYTGVNATFEDANGQIIKVVNGLIVEVT